jgi:hypothetical protein
MGPGEMFVALGLLVVMPIAIVWLVLHYRSRQPAGNDKANSLTATELRGLIREAVDEANLPLIERIEELEQEVEGARRRLPGGAADPRLLEP